MTDHDRMSLVCNDLLAIMDIYDRQVTELGEADTPGGLEHMSDVWKLFKRWQALLLAQGSKRNDQE